MSAAALWVSMDKQVAMLRELGRVRGEVIPLPITRSPSLLTDMIRHWIEELRVADHKVRQAHPETWAQAFERVCGEAWE